MHPYSDLDRPPLRADTLRRELVAESSLWSRLELVEETGSTNVDLAAAAREGASEGTVLVAEHQSAGRGRLDRTWESPPRAGIAVSVLLRPGVASRDWPEVPRKRWGWLPLLTGVALAEAVNQTAGVTATLKWPNDLLVDGRKCGGILADVTDDAVVVGVGLNVTLRQEELPPDPPWGVGATSLAVAGAASLDREELLVSLLGEFEAWYRRWRTAGGDAEGCGLRGAYLRGCDTVGRRVRALLPGGGELTGTAIMVDTDGRLVVRRRDGDTRAIASGDILHVRGLSDTVT